MSSGPHHTQAKGHDHVIVRAFDSHPKVVPLTRSAKIYVMLTSLLEVGALQIVAHHETLSIFSMSRKNPCTSFIHGNFFGPSGLHLLAWSEHRRSQSSRPMREVLEMQLERALSPDRLEELPLSPGYFFPRENVNPCHFQPSSYIFPCMTPPQAIIMHLCMLQCNIL